MGLVACAPAASGELDELDVPAGIAVAVAADFAGGVVAAGSPMAAAVSFVAAAVESAAGLVVGSVVEPMAGPAVEPPGLPELVGFAAADPAAVVDSSGGFAVWLSDAPCGPLQYLNVASEEPRSVGCAGHPHSAPRRWQLSAAASGLTGSISHAGPSYGTRP